MSGIVDHGKYLVFIRIVMRSCSKWFAKMTTTLLASQYECLFAM